MASNHKGRITSAMAMIIKMKITIIIRTTIMRVMEILNEKNILIRAIKAIIDKILNIIIKQLHYYNTF